MYTTLYTAPHVHKQSQSQTMHTSLCMHRNRGFFHLEPVQQGSFHLEPVLQGSFHLSPILQGSFHLSTRVSFHLAPMHHFFLSLSPYPQGFPFTYTYPPGFPFTYSISTRVSFHLYFHLSRIHQGLLFRFWQGSILFLQDFFLLLKVFLIFL